MFSPISHAHVPPPHHPTPHAPRPTPTPVSFPVTCRALAQRSKCLASATGTGTGQLVLFLRWPTPPPALVRMRLGTGPIGSRRVAFLAVVGGADGGQPWRPVRACAGLALSRHRSAWGSGVGYMGDPTSLRVARSGGGGATTTAHLLEVAASVGLWAVAAVAGSGEECPSGLI